MKRLSINEQKLVSRFNLLEQELKSLEKLLTSQGLFEYTSIYIRAQIKREYDEKRFA